MKFPVKEKFANYFGMIQQMMISRPTKIMNVDSVKSSAKSHYNNSSTLMVSNKYLGHIKLSWMAISK